MTRLVQQFIAFHKASYHGSTERSVVQSTAKFCRYFKDSTPAAITSPQVTEWIQHMLTTENASPNTVRIYVKVLRRIFAFAVLQGARVDNPFEKSKLPAIRAARVNRQFFTFEQYERVRTFTEDADAFWPSACVIGWHAGLRLSDVALLKWDNVDFGNQVITVSPKKKEALRERLVIPMEQELFNHLLALHNNREEPDSPYVLPAMKRTYTDSPESLSKAFGVICDLAGLPSHSYHGLRHSFVSRLLNSGTNPITIGEMTGQTLEVIQGYSHVSIEAKRVALQKSREFHATAEESTAKPSDGIAVSNF